MRHEQARVLGDGGVIFAHADARSTMSDDPAADERVHGLTFGIDESRQIMCLLIDVTFFAVDAIGGLDTC